MFLEKLKVNSETESVNLKKYKITLIQKENPVKTGFFFTRNYELFVNSSVNFFFFRGGGSKV